MAQWRDTSCEPHPGVMSASTGVAKVEKPTWVFLAIITTVFEDPAASTDHVSSDLPVGNKISKDYHEDLVRVSIAEDDALILWDTVLRLRLVKRTKYSVVLLCCTSDPSLSSSRTSSIDPH